MTINVKIIADSLNKETGARLTTVECRYPRFIHAEVMTHRVFSRNASSSRAIPVKKMIESVENDPVFPSFWGKNQKGMQAREEMEEKEKVKSITVWAAARDAALYAAKHLDGIGAHKQIVNRILEPFSHITTLISSTEWTNFFELRSHEDAQPEMKILSDTIRERMEESFPTEMEEGEWHLPYLQEDDYAAIYADSRAAPNPDQMATSISILVSVARCARVSYKTHDDRRPGLSEDLLLAEKLMEASPPHLSPTEHQAFADRWRDPRRLLKKDYLRDHLHGNFNGFCQFRKIFESGKKQ